MALVACFAGLLGWDIDWVVEGLPMHIHKPQRKGEIHNIVICTSRPVTHTYTPTPSLPIPPPNFLLNLSNLLSNQTPPAIHFASLKSF